MKCNKCPLYASWNNESDSGAACGLLGDRWDSPLQYEDKHGAVVGCYIDKHLIEKREKEYERELGGAWSIFFRMMKGAKHDIREAEPSRGTAR